MFAFRIPNKNSSIAICKRAENLCSKSLQKDHYILCSQWKMNRYIQTFSRMTFFAKRDPGGWVGEFLGTFWAENFLPVTIFHLVNYLAVDEFPRLQKYPSAKSCSAKRGNSHFTVRKGESARKGKVQNGSGGLNLPQNKIRLCKKESPIYVLSWF